MMNSLKRLMVPAAIFAAGLIPATAYAALPAPPAILEWQSSVKGWNDSYYWYEVDGKRYAFTSEAAFKSWFPGSPTGLSTASIPELAPIQLGGAVFHRPGERMLKFASSPRVYVVSRFGILRWVASEQVALELYGTHWNMFIDELPVTDYPIYRFGSAVTDAAEFDRAAYTNVTNPSSNAVNAQNRPPEALEAKLSLEVSRTDVTVGSSLKLTATVSETKAAWNTITIRFYDWQQQVIGTCRGTLSCSIPVTVGGPLGTQAFTARAFNTYEQAVESKPVVVTVSNP